MLEKISHNNSTRVSELFEFVSNNEDYDFYYYKADSKIYITDIPSLRTAIKDSVCNYTYSDKGFYKGVVLVLKSDIPNNKRFYVKMNATDPKVALDLLTILLWNFNRDLYARVKKDSKFIDVLKYKGFRFVAVKGNQILLERKAFPIDTSRVYRKEGDD